MSPVASVTAEGRDGRGWIICDTGVPVDLVCNALEDLHPTITAEADANARLISAAPDLLEALNSIFAKLDDPTGSPGHSHHVAGIWDSDNLPHLAGAQCKWCAQWEAARAAIAKAEGRS